MVFRAKLDASMSNDPILFKIVEASLGLIFNFFISFLFLGESSSYYCFLLIKGSLLSILAKFYTVLFIAKSLSMNFYRNYEPILKPACFLES